MKTKVLIPVMTMILAVGMSFTTLKADGKEKTELQSDYVRNNGSWLAIPEQNCGQGGYTCKVKFQENGTPYEVYDEMDLSTIKESPTPNAHLINP